MRAYRARKVWAQLQLWIIYITLSLGTSAVAFRVSAYFLGIWRYVIWTLIFGGCLFFIEIRIERSPRTRGESQGMEERTN